MDENAERAYESLEKVLGRIEKARQTGEGAEIYEVIRRQLFEDLGDAADHRATAEAYWDMYRTLGEDVSSSCREPVIGTIWCGPIRSTLPLRTLGHDP